MNIPLFFKNRETLGIFLVVLCFTIIAFSIRVAPAPYYITPQTYVLGGEPDIAYNLRQVEQMMANYPAYTYYDPMTQYPYGSELLWGPIFIFIIATACKLVGATTRMEIVQVAFIIPPLMGAAVVPIMYKIGTYLVDRKTGVLAAILTALIPGQFLVRSFYGNVDHHIAEVLFSALFALVYIIALIRTRDNIIDIKKKETLYKPVLYGVLAGIAYLITLYVMVTAILFALIVTITMIIQFVINQHAGKNSDSLLLTNMTLFAVAIIGVSLNMNSMSANLGYYSPAHLVAYSAVIISAFLLHYLGAILTARKISFLIYLPVAFGILLLVSLGMYLLVPTIFLSFFDSLSIFFGFKTTSYTIGELRQWTVLEMWFNYQFGLLFAGLGALLSLRYAINERRVEHTFLLIWTAFILISAYQHVRYEYYFSPLVALLTAIFVVAIINRNQNNTKILVEKLKVKFKKPVEEPPVSKRQQKKKLRQDKPMDASNILFICVMAFTVGYIVIISGYNWQAAAFVSGNTMNDDWRQACEWMGNNTPDPGVDYYTIYDKSTFTYPPQSYGVMSWWDYGHWITFFAKRIPIANPFQLGVIGNEGAAHFFITTDEKTAINITEKLGIKYVITDIEMDTGKFYAMATWNAAERETPQFNQIFLITEPENPTQLRQVNLYTDQYFISMISRFHNFDGSMGIPSRGILVEYKTDSRYIYPLVIRGTEGNITDLQAEADRQNRNATLSKYGVYSKFIILPVQKVPALKQFRLVYESPTNVMTGADMRYVKIFEYVAGTRIIGSGTITHQVTTNTGRQFWYTQESEGGFWVVPYPGEYIVLETGQFITVTEKQVQAGEMILP